MSGSYYEEFALQPTTAKAPFFGLAPPAIASPASMETLDAVLKKIQGAVLAVLGSAVGADVPLMEAGLDSLGRLARCQHACASVLTAFAQTYRTGSDSLLTASRQMQTMQFAKSQPCCFIIFDRVAAEVTCSS